MVVCKKQKIDLLQEALRTAELDQKQEEYDKCMTGQIV